jgi:NADH-quinone oxidoreductase subunit G
MLGLQTENLQEVYNSDVLYLLSADEVNLDKKNNQFIIYQVSHGGENSKIADVILPSAAYSEKNGSFVNLEGRVQKSYKASYPPGFAKEDFEIFNDIAKSKGSNHSYSSFENLREEMINDYKSLGIYDEIQPTDIENLKIERHVKKDHLIEINNIDYYQTNIIARSSKTMNECKSAKQQPRKTGTEN